MVAKDYAAILEVDQLQRLADKLLTDEKPIGFDLESGYHGPDFRKRSLDVYHKDQFVVGLSITNSPDWARYVPLAHDSGGNIDKPEAVWEILRPVLTQGDITAHNAKFELANVRKAGGYVIGSDGGNVTDTMLDASVVSLFCHSNYRTIVDLKGLVEAAFEHKMMHFQDLWVNLAVNKKPFIRTNTLDVTPQMIAYACEDAAWVLPLRELMTKRALLERPFMKALEHRIMFIMEDVERYGVSADWKGIEHAAAQAKIFVPKVEKQVKDELGEMAGRDLSDLNFNSPPQMKKLLFSDMGLVTTRLTAKGKDRDDLEPWQKMSTDAKALTALAKVHPGIKNLLEYREVLNLAKRLDKWLTEYSVADDGKVHANYKQAAAEGDENSAPGSGRFSAAEPAIQQLPKLPWKWVLNEDGIENGVDLWTGNFRDFIVASPGTYLLTYDYSQVELRVLAGASQEPALLAAFANNVDVHTVTAAQMLGKRVEDIDPDTERPIGKAQPLESKVLTPTGWRRFGDLVVGDQVIGSDGSPTTVTGVYPQGIKPVYEVTTSDGATTECCEEHLWTVISSNTHGAKWQTYELGYLNKKGLRNKASKEGYSKPKWRLPDRPVVQFAAQDELPIDPYILGLLLGDGCFTHTWATTFGSADIELLESVQKYHESLGGKVTEWKETSPGFWVIYLASGVYGTANPLSQKLRELGLWGVKKENKFVPSQYLIAPPEDRLALLQGLLDSDGCATKYGAGEFTNLSLFLAEAVQELFRSLGGTASRKLWNKKAGGFSPKDTTIWRVYGRLPNQKCPFRLWRKANARTKATRNDLPLKLLSALEVGEKATQCISVSAQNGLYITEGYIPTHNTLNFALLYGEGPQAMGEQLGITFDEAKMLHGQYFAAFTRVASWVNRVKAVGIEKGYAETIFGRKVPVWELRSPKKGVRAKGERILVNAPIQGSAADYMKIAMMRAHGELVKRGWWGTKCTIVMNQHDALTFEVSNELDPREVREVLQKCVVFGAEVVPRLKGYPTIVADWEMGQTWGGSTKWKDNVTPIFSDGLWELVAKEQAVA